jgi:site-specific recombinase XerD
MKVEDAIERLLVALLAEGVKKTTIKWYRVRFKRFQHRYGNSNIDGVSIDDVRSYLADLREEGISPHYFYSHARVVRRLFKWLYEERLIDEGFWKRIKLPKIPPAEPKGVDLEDVRKLLTACQSTIAGKRDKAIILFLMDTGCRVGGLCNLMIEEVDLDNLIAKVHEKGGRSRKVLFGEKTKSAIIDWLGVRQFEDSLFLFTSLRDGRPMNPNSVIQMLRRLGKKTGVEGRVNPHAFRHGFAREYLKNGGDLASVSDLLGHSQITVTKSNYAVFLVEEHREKHQAFSPVNYL